MLNLISHSITNKRRDSQGCCQPFPRQPLVFPIICRALIENRHLFPFDIKREGGFEHRWLLTNRSSCFLLFWRLLARLSREITTTAFVPIVSQKSVFKRSKRAAGRGFLCHPRTFSEYRLRHLIYSLSTIMNLQGRRRFD